LIRDVLAIRNQGGKWAPLGSSQTFRPSGVTSKVAGQEIPVFFLQRTVSADFLVRGAGVMGKEAYEVALGIYIAWENFWEEAQGYGFYALSQSSFSEEDLVSDLIGFYIGYGEVTGTDPNSLDDFKKLCGVIGYRLYHTDRDKYVKLQRAIWTTYEFENGPFRKHYEWGCRPPGKLTGQITLSYEDSAMLDEHHLGMGCTTVRLGDLLCEQQDQLPTELLRITPQPPGKNWLWRSGEWDLYEIQNRAFHQTPHFVHRVITFDPDEQNDRPLNWAGP
jgi:hypothetical protein